MRQGRRRRVCLSVHANPLGRQEAKVDGNMDGVDVIN